MKTSGCTIEILDRFNISMGCTSQDGVNWRQQVKFMPSFPILASTKDDVNWRQRVKFLRTKTSKIPTKVRLLVSLGFGRVSCVVRKESCVVRKKSCAVRKVVRRKVF